MIPGLNLDPAVSARNEMSVPNWSANGRGMQGQRTSIDLKCTFADYGTATGSSGLGWLSVSG